MHIYELPTSSRRHKAPILLYKSSGFCKFIPSTTTGMSLQSFSSHENRSPSSPGSSSGGYSSQATVIMDEPFYAKLSDFTQGSEFNSSAELHNTVENTSYHVVVIIRRLHASSNPPTWPFRIEPNPNTINKVANSGKSSPNGHNGNNSVIDSVEASTSLAHRKGMRHSSRRKTPTLKSSPSRSNPSRSARISSPGTSKSSAAVEASELRAHIDFSLSNCPPPGLIAPMSLYSHGFKHDSEMITVGLEIDMGWAIPQLERDMFKGATNDSSVSRQEGIAVVAEDTTIVEAQDLDLAERTLNISRVISLRGQSSGFQKTADDFPMIVKHEPIKIEARYHFALENTVKTFLLVGFGCPWCDNRNYASFDRLHFHFLTCHELFNFRTEARINCIWT